MAIERATIVEEALQLLDQVGMDGLTTRRLALRLGVRQPALYWHFRSKGDLLDALAAEILARHHPHRRPQPGEHWEEFTIAYARSFRHALLAVRDGARIFAGTRPLRDQFADAELQLALYVAAGFSAGEALRMSIAVARYVVGFVLEEQAEIARDGTAGNGGGRAEIAEALVRFPVLREAVMPLIGAGNLNGELVFESGLAYLVAGFRQSLVARDPSA